MRRLFTAFAALSLFACAYSAWRVGQAPYYGSSRLDAAYDVFQPTGPERPYNAKDVSSYRPPPPTLDLAGFRIQRTIRTGYTWCDGRLYLIPHWFLAMVWAIPPLLWVRRLLKEQRAARRRRARVCAACGYDLRATRDRCPECGAAVPPGAISPG
jgi:hypothetical protein